MHVGHMMRGLLGDLQVQSQDVRRLELREGQVVRGVVLQLLEGQDALISLNGVHVRARLETPLEAGQAAWLQVQAGSTDGQLVLRTVMMNEGAGEELFTRLLQQLGLPDTPLHRELLRQAQQLGVQLQTKEARLLSSFLSQQPAHVDAAGWMQSSIIAVQRGLPLSREAVLSIAQVIHGRPLPQLLSSIAAEIASLLASSSEHGGVFSLSGQAHGILTRLADAIAQWFAQARGMPAAFSGQGGATWMQGGTAGGMQSLQTAAVGRTAAANTAVPSTASPGSQMPGTQAAQPGSAASGQQVPAPASLPADTPPLKRPNIGNASSHASSLTAGNGRGSQMVQLGGPSGSGAAPHLIPASASARAGASSGKASADSLRTLPSNPSQALDAQTASAGRIYAAGEVARLDGSLLRQLLQTLGLDYEYGLMERLILQQPDRAANIMNPPTADSIISAPAAEQAAAAQEAAGAAPPPAAETIKSLLLQASTIEQLPAALRETIQQAAQAITGQQLLLSGDRHSPITYVTMFVPVMNEQGEHLASVHIQTRRGKRGELDSANCHLFFDLELEALGEMMIDMQVTERIVSLRIYNDHPLSQMLMQEGKEQIQQALEELGYHLSTLQAYPLPGYDAPPAGKTCGGEASAVKQQDIQGLRRYAAGAAYRGVDLRI
ncbi:hypothetical protein PRECH8_10470 [Insulibacter thermoxylanivorax]|uniref:Hook-length control protein FliK n=1 Tax=Insulibacter thermoxylanivorax TaxID=2749268 RepID=A0A916QBL6_9BACL|nr:hypothetical protein [Insulibacter thermoxylanivorax]GFR37751.1 hypothetical protein PRECH8_10470 [Insulibacter thermoxylanivorax]